MLELYTQEQLQEIATKEKNCLVNLYDNEIRSIMVRGKVAYRSTVSFPDSTPEDMANFEEDCLRIGIHPAGSYNAIWRRFTKRIKPASLAINGYFRDYFHGGWVKSFCPPKQDTRHYDINLAYGEAGYCHVPTDFIRSKKIHPDGFYNVEGWLDGGHYPFMSSSEKMKALLRPNEIDVYDVHDPKIVDGFIPIRKLDLRKTIDRIMLLKTHRKILKRYWGGWCCTCPLVVQHWKDGNCVNVWLVENRVNIPITHLVTSKVRQKLWLKCKSLGWEHCFMVQTDEVSTDLSIKTGNEMGEWKRKLPPGDILENISAGWLKADNGVLFSEAV
jgi:hypothetical protein